MENFRIFDESDLEEWVTNNPEGLIVNSNPSGFSSKYIVLHRSSCESFSKTGRSQITYSKYCFENAHILYLELQTLGIDLKDVRMGCTTCHVNRFIPVQDKKDLDLKVNQLLKTGLQSKPKGNDKPQESNSTITAYLRDPQVVAWVKNRAKGRCELCMKNAPFLNKDGFPYLEVHHVKPLSEGGKDVVKNCVALCPNCHREAHYSQESSTIAQRLARIGAKLDKFA
ncbi:TPA: HNH endonuclease [Vibrio vulnificus]|nr:HNH endonuclease [Vibrio vulnificus]